MNIPIIGEIFSGLLGIGKELIEDKDKRAEFSFRVAELQIKLAEKLLTMQTSPWVDAAVKLLYATKELIVPLFRPVVSGAMAGFVGYAQVKGITLSPAVEAAFAGAFPGWIISRHIEKKNGGKK